MIADLAGLPRADGSSSEIGWHDAPYFLTSALPMVRSLLAPTKLVVVPVAPREASVVQCVLGSPNGIDKSGNRSHENDQRSNPKKDQQEHGWRGRWRRRQPIPDQAKHHPITGSFGSNSQAAPLLSRARPGALPWAAGEYPFLVFKRTGP
jgi:hypothetical protein